MNVTQHVFACGSEVADEFVGDLESYSMNRYVNLKFS